MRPRGAALAALVATAAAGCQETPSPCAGAPAAPLVAATGWALVPPERDAYRAGLPDALWCGEGAFAEEDGGLEVTLSGCNAITLEQAPLAPLCGGDAVELTLWHLDLVAPAPTTGLIELAADGVPFWRAAPGIPSPARSYAESGALPGDPAQAAETLTLHIHNHGQNAYRLQSLARSAGR